jgi:hypothetical protein
MEKQSGARKIDSIFLAILIVLMCSQIANFQMGENAFAKEGFATKPLFIAYCDVFLLLTFAWFCLRTTSLKAWKKLWWPPLPCWALIIAMIIAALHSPTIVNSTIERLHEAHGPKEIIKAFVSQDAKESKEAIAEIIQFTMYFLIAPLVFVNLMHDRRTGELISRRRLALHAFSGALLLTTFIAFLELLTNREEHGPNALFDSPNAYAAFLALTMPFAVAHVLSIWNKPLPPFIATLATVALAAITVISPWATLAITFGILAAGALLRQPARALILLGLFFAVTLGAWATSSSLHDARSDFMTVNNTAKHEPKEGEEAPPANATPDLKKQYIEWYAALGWSQPVRVAGSETGERSKNFGTGVGPGNYQLNIGPYYSSLPNEEKMAPDSNNLYLVQAVALGALGLGALLWAVSHFASLALQARRKFPNDWLGAGVLASLVAAAFVNLFHALLVRGTGLTLAFLFSLAVIAWLQGENHADSQQTAEPSV